MNKIIKGLIIIAALNFITCTLSLSKTPRLVVLLVVDQMRPDLLTRFDDLYKGGFRWLMDNGIWFTDTHHEHSYTATGPGHTAIGFGQNPGKLGVIGNSFYDRNLKKNVNCVEDPKAKIIGSNRGKARSAVRIDSNGLGDWIKQTHPSSRVISIGGKDRAACLLGGKNPDQAIYYNNFGEFVSSDYYVNQLPSWATKFNNELKTRSYGDSLWRRSLDESFYEEYAREDYFYGEEDNYKSDEYSPVFPIGTDLQDDPLAILMGKPWFEREVLLLSKYAVLDDSLGFDEAPDFLSIGLSSMDWIIHSYGPFSQEAMDACIKLDTYLGDFIEFLDDHVGLYNVLFALTADHGGLPLPEYLVAGGQKAGRINKNHFEEALTWIDEESEEKFGKKLYRRDGGNFFLNKQKIKDSNVQPKNIYKIISKYLTKVEGIERMVIKEDILDGEDTTTIGNRLANMIHPDLTPEIFPVISPNYLYRGPLGTSHGSPYDYDTHVPMIFSRKGFRAKQKSQPYATIDIAPTIAKYLNIDVPEYCDGKAFDL